MVGIKAARRDRTSSKIGGSRFDGRQGLSGGPKRAQTRNTADTRFRKPRIHDGNKMENANAANPQVLTRSLLERCSAGDAAAYDALFSAVYDDLMVRARRLSRGAGKTLSTTALVHETYLKLAGSNLSLNDEAHFFALAARVMRQIVINAARDRGAQKRGGGLIHATLDSALAFDGGTNVDFLALEQALVELAEADPRLGRVVDLHFYAGLGFSEIGRLLGVTERTISRDWRAARAILQSHLDTTAPSRVDD
jgi:RNA polymerase sigma factor (TIGR02999 family)